MKDIQDLLPANLDLLRSGVVEDDPLPAIDDNSGDDMIDLDELLRSFEERAAEPPKALPAVPPMPVGEVLASVAAQVDISPLNSIGIYTIDELEKRSADLPGILERQLAPKGRPSLLIAQQIENILALSLQVGF